MKCKHNFQSMIVSEEKPVIDKVGPFISAEKIAAFSEANTQRTYEIRCTNCGEVAK